MQNKRILFINFGGIGDEILFLPSILSAKKQFPDSYITLALEERSKGITSLTNVIDETICVSLNKKPSPLVGGVNESPNQDYRPSPLVGGGVNVTSNQSHRPSPLVGEGGTKCRMRGTIKNYFELFKLLVKIWLGKYDLVVSSGSNKFISIFLFLTFIKERYGYNTGKLSEILLTKAIPLNKNQYAVNMYHDLVTPITDIKTPLPEINISNRYTNPDTVLIHPGVSKMSVEKGMIKTIRPKEWAEVIERLYASGKVKIQLIGGPDDKECIETIQKLVSPEKFENLYGKTKNLKELAELISFSEKFLCSDSAPLHIAVALGVKTYVIFGSTDDKKLIPKSGRVIPIKANCNCPLQPCLWEKRQTTCEELTCLKIPPEKVVDIVLSK